MTIYIGPAKSSNKKILEGQAVEIDSGYKIIQQVKGIKNGVVY